MMTTFLLFFRMIIDHWVNRSRNGEWNIDNVSLKRSIDTKTQSGYYRIVQHFRFFGFAGRAIMTIALHGFNSSFVAFTAEDNDGSTCPAFTCSSWLALCFCFTFFSSISQLSSDSSVLMDVFMATLRLEEGGHRKTEAHWNRWTLKEIDDGKNSLT